MDNFFLDFLIWAASGYFFAIGTMEGIGMLFSKEKRRQGKWKILRGIVLTIAAILLYAIYVM